MPVVQIPVNRLRRLIGQDLPTAELSRVLTEIGCDVAEFDPATGTLKIDLLPARPDMFDLCGLARCVRGFLGIETGLPAYSFSPSGIRVQVKEGLETVRPGIAAAVVKGIALDEELVKLLLDLQENLHWGLGRNRKRASIGIYDLNTIQPDIIYQPVTPDGIRFVPLGSGGEKPVPLTPAEILAQHPKGQAYRNLLNGLPVYPLLTDSKGRVLSMPPIINSHETRVTEKTRALFVDVTGFPEWTVKKTLAVIAATMSDLGAEVQTVTTVYPDGRVWETPDMKPETMTVDPAEVNAVIGVDLSPASMIELLRRMRYDATLRSDRIQVAIPAYRTDILHPRDIVEDIAIALGFANIPAKTIATTTPSRPQPVEEESGLWRAALTGLGFIETISLCLTSPETQFEKLGLTDDGNTIEVENPVSVEQRILRRHLLASLLTTFSLNATHPQPQNVFEVGDVFWIDESAETRIRSSRHLALGMADAKVGFAEIKAVVQAVDRELDRNLLFVPAESPLFLPGRCAVLRNREGKNVGIVGEVHPLVLERFELLTPIALAEIAITTDESLSPLW